jgi:hypothetical protein
MLVFKSCPLARADSPCGLWQLSMRTLIAMAVALASLTAFARKAQRHRSRRAAPKTSGGD